MQLKDSDFIMCDSVFYQFLTLLWYTLSFSVFFMVSVFLVYVVFKFIRIHILSFIPFDNY